jgi:hypothetical protein
MIRIYNDNLGRALHSVLYQRIHDFCIQYTPEFPAEAVVNNWLSRLYQSDLTLHILVELDDTFKITEHAIIEVSTILNNKVVYCHQVKNDKPSISHMGEIAEYLDKLQEHEGATCTVVTLTALRQTKGFEKKYNYQAIRTVMIKTAESVGVEHG